MCWTNQKAKILPSAVRLMLLLVGMTHLSAFPAGKESCTVMVGERIKQDNARNHLYQKIMYRVVGVKDGIEVNAKGFLGKNDVAVTFDLDGKIRLYYGDMEALFERKTDVTFEVIPALHELDISEHDVILIYKDLPRRVLEPIRSLFEFGSGSNPVVPGYNCVDAVCRVMRSVRGDEVQANIFHTESAFSELISMHKYRSDMKADIFISSRAGNLEGFYHKIKDGRTTDGLSRAERAAKGVISHAVIGAMFGAPVMATVYMIWDMLTY